VTGEQTLFETRLYIDGELRRAEGDRTFDDISPWSGRVIGKVAHASPADVAQAIAAARRAFDTTNWSKDHAGRVTLLEKLRDLFVANRERLVRLVVDEAGSTPFFARMAQVEMALEGYRDLIDVSRKLVWEEDRGQRGPHGRVTRRIVLREAAGVVGAITPFNVPFYVIVEKVVSAILAGCTVVLKPSPYTSALGAMWGELATEARFPAGVLNIVTGPEPDLGEQLVTDPRVDLITFTGSSAVGKSIMQMGGPTLKRVLLELGGKSAKIILDDVPDFAREVASSILVGNSGQGCIAQSRLLVSRARYAEAVDALKGAYATFDGKWGNYDDQQSMMGPVISRRQMERIKGFIEQGVKEGASLIAGGNIRPDKGGFFVEPTCFVDVTNDMTIAQEEIFGPVLAVIPYEDEDDAVRIANDSGYGLSGGIASGDTDRALRVAARIRSGTVSINGGRCVDGDLPFGGYKASGLGRAWGVEGLEDYTMTKVVAYRVG
jgi:aldehyde dehydrogenase (NAD+)